MGEFQELRYPFDSLLEFFQGGYWIEVEALHLTLGLIFLLGFIAWTLISRGDLIQAGVIIYFATAPFNNPAYSLAGLRFNEMAAIGAVLWFLAGVGKNRVLLRDSPVAYAVIFAGALITAHALLVAPLFPELNEGIGGAFLRLVVIGKIFVLGLVMLAFDKHFCSRADVDRLVTAMVFCGMIASVFYLVQAGVFLSGTLPYGTYWDAGFTGVPSFGSVSIERGHFGKFVVPLFPFFLLVLVRRRAVLWFGVFLLVSILNFSASNLAFLVGYIALAGILFAPELLRGRRLVVVIAAGMVVAVLVARFTEQYRGVIDKIVDLGLRGGQGGGRGVDLLITYLSIFPLGISYGGSMLRDLPWVAQLNMGVYVFVVQLSMLAVPLIVGYFVLNYLVLRNGWHRVDPVSRRLLLIGAVMSTLIFAIDVLWFIPVLWAPLMIFHKLKHLGASESVQPLPDGILAAPERAAPT